MLHFPSSPNVDEIYEGPNIKWRWDGARWVRLGGGAGGAGVSVGEFPPANPKEGDLWFDAVEGQLYIWFNDGTSSQWVVTINQGGGGGGGPAFEPDTTGTGDVFVLQDQPTIRQPCVMGVTDGSNAAPGEVGEFLTATAANLIGVSLVVTAGDWDIFASTSWVGTLGAGLNTLYLEFSGIGMLSGSIIGTQLANMQSEPNIVVPIIMSGRLSATSSGVLSFDSYMTDTNKAVFYSTTIIARRMR